MKKCTGQNTQEWGLDAIFDVKCPQCGCQVEFFKDEITRNCQICQTTVSNDRQDFGCRQWCSPHSTHTRSYCSKFKRSKARFYGHFV